MEKSFLAAVQARRSYYEISKGEAIEDERIVEIIQDAVKYAPSAFNSQSARLVILLGTEHDKFWQITKETLRKLVDGKNFGVTEKKINGFSDGYGTVLYFEDVTITQELQGKFPLYKDNFPIWAQQSSGILQYIIWTALEDAGWGASLQHYNPLVDEEVKTTWNIPENYKLIAQMPFGRPIAIPEEKEYIPLNERIKLYK